MGWFLGIKTFFTTNKWALWVAGVVGAILALKAYEKRAEMRGREIGRRKAEDAFRKAIDDANEQTVSRIEEAREAVKELDDEFGQDPMDFNGDGEVTADDLNARERARLDRVWNHAEGDPNNLGPVVRRG